MASGFSVEPDIEIHVESVGGDLVIEGRAEAEIRARGDDLTLNIEEDRRRATVSAGGDCRLRVPDGARIEIESVGGDTRVTEVAGPITVSNVSGDLVVRDTANEVKIDNVGADLELKRIKGSVEVSNVGADASFREVEGSLRVSMIGADALVSDVGASCEIDVVGADLVLKTGFKAGSTYRFGSVGSDVLTKLQPGADVRFVLPHSTRLDIGLPDARTETGDEVDTIVVGNGSAVVTFENVGGEVTLAQHDQADAEDWFENIIPENLEDIISTQINLHLDRIREKAERQAERARERAERESERAREKAERIAERARRHAEQMQRRAEQDAERMRRRAEGRHWGRGWNWGLEFAWPGGEKRKRGGPFPPEPPFPGAEKRKRGANEPAQRHDPVTNEERMSILRMVENKQITVEEAERLLSALEGQD
jgi:flagellar biosynthesis GTPase FlhF